MILNLKVVPGDQMEFKETGASLLVKDWPSWKKVDEIDLERTRYPVKYR